VVSAFVTPIDAVSPSGLSLDHGLLGETFGQDQPPDRQT
jgi:hypothetical protein